MRWKISQRLFLISVASPCTKKTSKRFKTTKIRVSLTNSLSTSSLTIQLNKTQAKTLVAAMYCIWQMFMSAEHHKCAGSRTFLGNKNTTGGWWSTWTNPCEAYTTNQLFNMLLLFSLTLDAAWPSLSWVLLSADIWKTECKSCWGGAPEIKILQLENGDSCWAGVTHLRWVSKSNLSTLCSSHL